MAAEIEKMVLYWVVRTDLRDGDYLIMDAGPYTAWTDAFEDNKAAVVAGKLKIVRQVMEVVIR